MLDETQDGASPPAAQFTVDRFPVHPAAELFPMMSDAELDALGADIKKRGLDHGITLWTPATNRRDVKRGETFIGFLRRTGEPVYLLDGRNRVEAVRRFEEKYDAAHPDDEDGCFRVEDLFSLGGGDSFSATLLWGDDDPYAFVISANIHRRHLTLDDRKRLVIELAKARPEMSNRQIAEQVKLSHPTVAKVRLEAEAAGDVENVSTSRIDTAGRAQPAKKPAKEPKPAKFTSGENGAWLRNGKPYDGPLVERQLTRPCNTPLTLADGESWFVRVPAECVEADAATERAKATEPKAPEYSPPIEDRLAQPEPEARTDEDAKTAAQTFGAVMRLLDDNARAIGRARKSTRIGFALEVLFRLKLNPPDIWENGSADEPADAPATEA